MGALEGIDVAPLAQWLRERIDAYVKEATTAIYAGVPAYHGSDDHGLHDEVSAHVRQVYLAFVDTLAERRAPERGDFAWTVGHAARRVESGISLADFLKAFRIGQGVLWEHVLHGWGDVPDRQGTALSIVGHLMETIEVGSSAAAEAYVEAAKLRGADDARVERDLLEDLLAGRAPVVEARRGLLAQAGLEPGVPLLVGVGHTIAPSGFSVLPEAAHLASNALAQHVQGLVVVRQEEVVAVFPAEPLGERAVLDRIERLVESLAGRGIPMSLGVSSVRRDFVEVPDAYREADLARSMLGDQVGVKALSSLSTLDYLVVRPDDSARRLIRPEVRTFIAEDLESGGVFVETLLKYVAADMNAKAAGAQLHVHVNTVYYRLDRITERTGYDLRRVNEVIDLLLAVRLLTS